MIGHACMMVLGDTIDVGDVPEYLRAGRPAGMSEAAAVAVESAGLAPSLSSAEVGSLEEQEKILIMRALETAGGNQSQAARLLQDRPGCAALQDQKTRLRLRHHPRVDGYAAARAMRVLTQTIPKVFAGC